MYESILNYFRFWSDDWSGLGPLRDAFPWLYGLSVALEATVQQAWCPSLPDVMSDQRLEDILRMQMTQAHLRPIEAVGNAWEWRGARFSAQGVYKLLLDTEPNGGPGSGGSVSFALEASNSAEDQDIRMASHPGPPDDTILAAAIHAESRRRLRHILCHD